MHCAALLLDGAVWNNNQEGDWQLPKVFQMLAALAQRNARSGAEAPLCHGAQEPWVQQRRVRAVQAQPGQALHGQFCAQVLGGRQAAGQVRGRHPGGAHQCRHRRALRQRRRHAHRGTSLGAVQALAVYIVGFYRAVDGLLGRTLPSSKAHANSRGRACWCAVAYLEPGQHVATMGCLGLIQMRVGADTSGPAAAAGLQGAAVHVPAAGQAACDSRQGAWFGAAGVHPGWQQIHVALPRDGRATPGHPGRVRGQCVWVSLAPIDNCQVEASTQTAPPVECHASPLYAALYQGKAGYEGSD